jgi:hypothetical protein
MVGRLRWLAPPGLVAALALGWMVGPVSAYRPARQLPSPVFAADDGLPAELVAGVKYTARFTVTLPVDWPVQENSDMGSRAMVLMVARGRPTPDTPEPPIALYCSHGYPNAAGTTVTMDCPLFAPDPGPWELTVSADTGSFLIQQLISGGTPTVDDTLHVYHHTIVPAPSPS